ncbi:MAG: PAS domain S-box protein, partial [Desulfobacterales bacterium]|nr:PAS domain S-box protein [Desulfobacterales bacterium]
IHLGVVGGGDPCVELLEKTSLNFAQGNVNARILAVADPDPDTPGMTLARKLGLSTMDDYHDLYKPEYDIQLIVILTPGDDVLNDILSTKPLDIRIIAHDVFKIFWEAIRVEDRKLKERNEEVETILNAIQDFICVVSPNKKIMDINETLLDKLCYSREEVIGRNCYEIFQKSPRQCRPDTIHCPLEEVIRNKRKAQRVFSRTNKQGEIRYFEVTIYPIWEEDGRISKFIDISRDITERKKEEEEITRRLERMVEERTHELKETHEKLIHKDKMASLGKLSASVVHEINNPIAGILNLIMLIKRIMGEGLAAQKELDLFDKYLNLMETETRRIGRIVSNLLAFSRQSRIEMKRLNLNRLIEKTLFLNANLLKIHSVKVEKRFEPDLPELVGSPDQIQQVLMNFISNAAEAIESAGGGLLT